MKNRIALVTGASRGLGLAIAVDLAKAGAKVAINYHRNDEDARHALEQVSRHGEARLFKADALKERSARKLVAAVHKTMGPIEILVINATPEQKCRPIEKYKEAEFRSMIDAFLMSPHYLTKAVIESMKARGYGRIVNITSEVFYDGGAPFSAYVAAKGAQIGYLRSTATELAPFGITVNGVAPGWIPVERHRGTPEHVLQEYVKTVPVGRLGRPEDIAAAVLFFASERAGFVTGQSLVVNGGRRLD